MVAPVSDFETSSSYLTALIRGLNTLGRFEAVVAQCPPDAVAMLRAPRAQSWWPSAPAMGGIRAISAVGGSR